MSGIYIHIPFCRQACHYCNFHFSTSLKYKDDMVAALVQEIKLRSAELSKVSTIYFGGGTPSLLTVRQINMLIDSIFNYGDTSELEEVTMEVNPDDITYEYLKTLTSTPINRLSIGVQSFFDADLKWMNRAHDASMAESSVKQAQDIGLDNISIDLIYGSPSTSDSMWAANLEKWQELNLPHLSSYALTVEPGTALSVSQKKGDTDKVDDETAARQFSFLQKWVAEKGVNHYEISNFCTGENFAKHNTNYWFGKSYVGIGPGAHSFDGKKVRSWNESHNINYLKRIKEMGLSYMPFEQEVLSQADQHNEYLMTRLRTKWGVEQSDFVQRFGTSSWGMLMTEAESWISRGELVVDGGVLKLPASGQFLADTIIANLFIDT